jgi:hypothetical protein
MTDSRPNRGVETSGRSIPVPKKISPRLRGSNYQLAKRKTVLHERLCKPAAGGAEVRNPAAARAHLVFSAVRTGSHDFEGIVAKRIDDPYEPNVRWLKIKNPDYRGGRARGVVQPTPQRLRRGLGVQHDADFLKGLS